jgi:CheY-like chemotaxis protein
MGRKRYTPEQIIGKLRETEVPLPQGQTAADVMERKFKILLLEAVESSAEMVEYELSKASKRFTLARVETQESYLRALQEFCPDLILADCRLPHTDCLMALALAQDICPEVPFLFLSGDMSPATSRARPKIISFLAAAGQEPMTC